MIYNSIAFNYQNGLKLTPLRRLSNPHSNDYSWVKIGVIAAEISQKSRWHTDRCTANFREPYLLIRPLDFQDPYLFKNGKSRYFQGYPNPHFLRPFKGHRLEIRTRGYK